MAHFPPGAHARYHFTKYQPKLLLSLVKSLPYLIFSRKVDCLYTFFENDPTGS